MCQVDDGELYMRNDSARVRKTESRSECVKCASTDVVIPHGGHAALCRVCFLGNVNHKFRATVAKSQAFRQGESVLIAYSGGVTSGAMLAMVAEGVKEETKKKLRFRPGAILHVDESAALDFATEDESLIEKDSASSEWIESIVGNARMIFGANDDHVVTKLPHFYFAPLENAMAIEDTIDVSGEPDAVSTVERTVPSTYGDSFVNVNQFGGADLFLQSRRSTATQENRRRLKRFLGNLKSPTSRIRAIALLRRKLMSRIGRMLGYHHLMEGVSAPRVAIEIMTDLALGRGTQIPRDVGLIDDRFKSSDGVSIVRPLREFSEKEIVVYSSLTKVPTLVAANLETGTPASSSIQRATEDFILGLQADFSSTVSTVCKTGEKLSGSQKKQESDEAVEMNDRCSLCNTILDVPEASSMDELLLSQLSPPLLGSIQTESPSSRATAARALDVTTVISRASFRETSSSAPISKAPCDSLSMAEIIRRGLCYSCRLISREMSESEKSRTDFKDFDVRGKFEHLPSFLVKDAITRNNRDTMKDKIKCYLLADP